MSFMLINLLVLAVAAAAGLAAYAWVEQSRAGDDWPSPAVDYAALHAHWCQQGQVSDWDSLHAQVRRWQEIAAPGSTREQTEQVARDLNAAVFGFAMPARSIEGGTAPARRRARRPRP